MGVTRQDITLTAQQVKQAQAGEASKRIEPHPKAVVVLAGGRDSYQLPLALDEGGLLDTLVTDLYWPADKRWFSALSSSLVPRKILSARYCSKLDGSRVLLSKRALVASTLSHIAPRLNLNRYKDRAVSKRGGRVALRHHAALFCCNYYASEAFKHKDALKYRFLFQLQADFQATRRILLEEIERTPIAKASLSATYELSLSDKELEELCNEPSLANGWVTTSSFAARTLAERGLPAEQIHVVPYGVDTDTFAERARPPDSKEPFKIIYVGSLIQRKGLSYLLDAMRMVKSRNVRLTLCTRGLIDEQLLAEYADLDIEIKIGLSGRSLANELHTSDVFVFPSLAEGFALVILETMSCGVPVITTSHTCAPDVMVDGEHGFIVPIRDAEAIAEKLTWGIEHRADLAAMGEAAAARARHFTWERFREGIRAAYAEMIDSAVTA
ncbi:MAG TPA: glycosyltransferase family 4 protein [Blastocatellia bacterium]|nr:glycosyltransferase family 4 protein [Blastocatellia bacterium]